MNQTLQLDFMIIGAAKCATGWLANCLVDHPEVHIPPQEFHQFSWHYDERDPLPASYVREFAAPDGCRVVGERSNTYISSPEAIDRIVELMPGIKMIASLRHPVDRAYSDYCMFYRWGRVDDDIVRHLDPEMASQQRFVNDSRYAQQIAHVRSRVPDDRLLWILQDDMRADAAGVFAQTCRFLGVDATFEPELLKGRFHRKDAPVMRPALVRMAQGTAWTQSLVRKIKGLNTYRRYIRPLLTRKIDYPELPATLRKKMVEYFLPDTEYVEQLTGRELLHWRE